VFSYSSAILKAQEEPFPVPKKEDHRQRIAKKGKWTRRHSESNLSWSVWEGVGGSFLPWIIGEKHRQRASGNQYGKPGVVEGEGREGGQSFTWQSNCTGKGS